MFTGWVLPALAAVFCWGVSDLFFKVSSRSDDHESHLKISVWFGVWMSILIPIGLPLSESGAGLSAIIAAHPFIFGVSLVYAVALMLTNVGLRHLDLSVQSPVENASAAVPPVFFLIWFLAKGKVRSIWEIATVWDFVGTAVIVAGIVALTFAERGTRSGVRNRLGPIALVFPLLLTLGDGLETIVGGLALDETGGGVGEIDFILMNSVAFVLVGVGCWLRLYVRNRRVYNLFARGEWPKCGAGGFEIAAYFCYVYALGINPTFVAPVTSGYCLVTIVLSRLILKERPGMYRYLCLSAVFAGIVILSVSEALKP